MLSEIKALLPALRLQYHHLLLIVGPIGTGKTPLLKALCSEEQFPYLNVNLALSEQLLELTEKERPVRVRRLLAKLLDQEPGDVLVLDNIELLFDPALHQDPLVCLQGLSRSKTLITAWGGSYVDNVLTYAEPGHPEHRRYVRPNAMVITLS